jgi:hypothetical protein
MLLWENHSTDRHQRTGRPPVRKTAETIDAIRFTCRCGRTLKASERLAGKASRCPACGTAVVVPDAALEFAEHEYALKPESPIGHCSWPTLAVSANSARRQRPGKRRIVFASIDEADSATLAAPPTDLLPESQLQSCDANDYALSEPPPTTYVPSALAEPVPNYVPPAPFERSTFEVWCDPLTGVKFVFYLSGFLALLTALGAGLYPHVLRTGLSWVSGLFLGLVCAGAMAILIGYGCSFLESVLVYALCGGTRSIQVPDFDPRPAVIGAVRWGLAFACGPALLVWLAFRHWVYCGNVTWIDGLIMVELTMPAIGYLMIAALVLATRPDLVWASPRQVLNAAWRLGWCAPSACVAATTTGFVHLCVGAWGVTLLHSSWLGGLVILWLSWFSAWQCSTYALWTLGWWYHRRA